MDTHRAYRAVVEIKDDITGGKIDPSIQGVLCYEQYWFEDERIAEAGPTTPFIVPITGAWMFISGAVFVDKTVANVYHTFLALRRSLVTLDTFYRTLPLYSPENPDECLLFPRISQFPDSTGQMTEFRYIEKLGSSQAKTAFMCITTTDEHIVVKFVNQYNTEAHRLLADAHHAPRLLYAAELDGPPTAGGLWMVVMEYIPGKTLYQSGNLGPEAYKKLVEAIKLLHEHDFVFGDLRAPNIVLRAEDSPVLVDFDWCSKAGQGTYPVNLNEEINGHEGVREFAVMEKEHD
ncbi:hypothetical protein FRB99_004699 [Tulasnella sp. 403]|nr:hypothetical protein FRB99_004699 [Tulasnella sp. 403]